MPIIIIIDKNGDLREKKIKDDIEPDELYKVVKLKNSDDFENEASWDVDVDDKTYNISLFAKTTGNAGQENKYELPPPVDDILYFGKSILINEDGSDLTSYLSYLLIFLMDFIISICAYFTFFLLLLLIAFSRLSYNYLISSFLVLLAICHFALSFIFIS